MYFEIYDLIENVALDFNHLLEYNQGGLVFNLW